MTPHVKLESAYSIRAAERVLDILDFLSESEPRGGVALTEIAAALTLPKSSAFRYLAILEGRGYVQREPANGGYRLGLALVRSQAMYTEMLVARALPHLQELRDRFRETINLGALYGNRVVYLEILESPRTMRLAARRGDRDYIHSTALGKAVAAQLADDHVRSALAAEGMPHLTPHTITDPKEFLRVVAAVREKGFAVDDEENEKGARCVAVPLSSPHVTAAISLSAPAVRLPSEDLDGVADALRRTARKVKQYAVGGGD